MTTVIPQNEWPSELRLNVPTDTVTAHCWVLTHSSEAQNRTYSILWKSLSKVINFRKWTVRTRKFSFESRFSKATCERNFPMTFQCERGLTVTLPSYKGCRRGRLSSPPWPWPWISQGHISMHSTYRTTSIPNHVTLASSNREIWPFESPVVSIFREVWSRDRLLRRKFKKWALISCRLGPVLS